MSRPHLRLACLLGAATLSTVAAAPALAAAPVAQAGANAVTVSLGGNGQGSGTATATNDGSRESRGGDATPPTSVLAGQQLLRAGVLAQEATARKDGTSAACAGLAGSGGTVQVGESRCLTPGTPVRATLGSFSLGDLSLSTSALDKALAPLKQALTQLPSAPAAPGGSSSASPTPGASSSTPDPLEGAADAVQGAADGSSPSTSTPSTAVPGTSQAAGTPDLGTLTGPVTQAVDSAVAQVQAAVGEIGVTGGFGLVEGRCTAGPGTAVGSARLADAGFRAVLPGGRTVTLASLPADPAPNTHVFTNLEQVTALLLKDLRADLDTSFDGMAAPLAAAIDPVQEQVVNKVVAQVGPQLAPLQQNLLDITLNKQVRPTRDSIKVRALQVDVLPAAVNALGAPAGQVQVGNAACGPSGRAAQAAAPAPAMPTAVSAGLATTPGSHAAEQDPGHQRAVLIGAFAILLAAAAGTVAWRRRA